MQVAVAYASSPDPGYGLELELSTNGIRSVPQVLLDVLYADNNSRPQPFEVRHILNSRPAVAAADYAVTQSLQELLTLLQSHPAPAQLSYDDSKQQLTIIPISGGPSIPNAAQHYHRLHQCAARVSSMMVALRNAAPGLRLVVTVVPSPAPGARTFSWRLLSRRNAAEVNNTASQVRATSQVEAAAAAQCAGKRTSLLHHLGGRLGCVRPGGKGHPNGALACKWIGYGQFARFTMKVPLRRGASYARGAKSLVA